MASALVGGASGHCQNLSVRFFSGEGSHQRLVYGRDGGNGRHRSFLREPHTLRCGERHLTCDRALSQQTRVPTESSILVGPNTSSAQQ